LAPFDSCEASSHRVKFVNSNLQNKNKVNYSLFIKFKWETNKFLVLLCILSKLIKSLLFFKKENQVYLRKVRSSTVVNIQDLSNQPMSPCELIKTLRKRGLEVSPSHRVSSEVEDMPVKNEQMERHIYRCMALGATTQSFSFLWSRWNNVAGKDIFVFQMQTFDGENLSPAHLIQVEPKRTRILPFTESSQSMDDLTHSDSESKVSYQLPL
jgi:hypothetical protein